VHKTHVQTVSLRILNTHVSFIDQKSQWFNFFVLGSTLLSLFDRVLKSYVQPIKLLYLALHCKTS